MVNAVIVAAGQGKRLGAITNEIPKCMVKINGLTILDYQINNLLRNDAKNIIVVTGFKKEKVMINQKKKNVKFIYNDIYKDTEASYSLFLAMENMDDEVIILDGDVIFHPKLLELLIESRGSSVIVDFTKPSTPEDLKVITEKQYVKDMSKNIDGNGIWVSLLKLEGLLLNKFKILLTQKKYWNKWYSEPLREILSEAKLRAVSTNGLPWSDIDTQDDLKYAREEIYPRILREKNV